MAPICVTYSTCYVFLLCYLNGDEGPPALPAHHWTLGQEPGLLTSGSQTSSVAWGYECELYLMLGHLGTIAYHPCVYFKFLIGKLDIEQRFLKALLQKFKDVTLRGLST